MARLPTRDDLGPLPSARTGRAIARIDTSDVGRGAAALGEGIAKLGLVLDERQQQEEEYEAHKRFIDFDLQREKALDDAKREAPEDARGFTPAYRQQYDQSAREFFASVPERLKPKYDDLLVQRGAQYEKRAYDWELATRDKYHVDDVSRKLLDLHNEIAANPERKTDMIARGLSLTRTAPVPAATRLRLERVFGEQAEEVAVDALRARANGDPDKLNELRRQILEVPRSSYSAGSSTSSIEPRKDGLATIRTASGAEFHVAADHAERFKGALDELEAAGVAIKAEQSGGYNPRNIRGTNVPSQHASGRAIDVNWSENARGSEGKIDPELARSVATKWGLKWGGDFKNPDPMHFEVAADAGALPIAKRGVTTVAGLDDKGAEETTTATLPEGAFKPSDTAPFPLMRPERRRAALTKIDNDLRASAQTALSNYEAHLLKNGGVEPPPGPDGKTPWQRYAPILTEKQQQDHKARIQVASMVGAARAQLGDVRDADQLDELVTQLGDATGDTAEITKAKETARKQIEGDFKRLQLLRKRDPALAMESSSEVREARTLIDAAKTKAMRLGIEDGGVVVREGEPVPLPPQEFWGRLFKARAEAQRRLKGARLEDAFLLTQQESRQLLDITDPKTLTEAEFPKRMRAAVDRAEQLYGKEWAAPAFDSAYKLIVKNSQQSQVAASIAARLWRGATVTKADLDTLQKLDEIGRMEEAFGEPLPDEERPTIAGMVPPEMVANPFAQPGTLASPQFMTKPEDEDIAWLKRNPDKWERFDAEYGRGAAARVLTPEKKKGWFR